MNADSGRHLKYIGTGLLFLRVALVSEQTRSLGGIGNRRPQYASTIGSSRHFSHTRVDPRAWSRKLAYAQ